MDVLYIYAMVQSDEVVIRNRDGDNSRETEHPIVIVLDRLRSAYNVGNIFRLAEVCAVEQVVTCGYTAHPPHPKIAKTALGTEERVPNVHFAATLDAVTGLRNKGYQIIGIETVENAPPVWEVSLEFPVAFVFGNEALGIGKDTLLACDVIAQLPAFGWKNSLNVANCATAVVYQAIRQLEEQQHIQNA